MNKLNKSRYYFGLFKWILCSLGLLVNMFWWVVSIIIFFCCVWFKKSVLSIFIFCLLMVVSGLFKIYSGFLFNYNFVKVIWCCCFVDNCVTGIFLCLVKLILVSVLKIVGLFIVCWWIVR